MTDSTEPAERGERGEAPGRRLDYSFANGRRAVAEARLARRGRTSSDHYTGLIRRLRTTQERTSRALDGANSEAGDE